jgi:hypothetical protein
VAVRFILDGRPYELKRQRVLEAMRGKEPEPIQEYSVAIAGVAFPPKQVLEESLGVSRRQFGTQRAVRVLTKLGFEVRTDDSSARLAAPPQPVVDSDDDDSSPLSVRQRLDVLRTAIEYVGQPPTSTVDQVIEAADRFEAWVRGAGRRN